MFVLSFQKKHRVVLARFSGIVSSEDLKQLDYALAALVARKGFVRGIFDFSTIEASFGLRAGRHSGWPCIATYAP
jgi:hypothetical protein